MKNLFQARREENLIARMDQAHKIIMELIAALDHKDPEIRALIRDTALSYMETVKQNVSDS